MNSKSSKAPVEPEGITPENARLIQQTVFGLKEVGRHHRNQVAVRTNKRGRQKHLQMAGIIETGAAILEAVMALADSQEKMKKQQEVDDDHDHRPA